MPNPTPHDKRRGWLKNGNRGATSPGSLLPVQPEAQLVFSKSVESVKISRNKDAQRIHVVTNVEETLYFGTCEILEPY
jgi:hypothetical protein